MGVRVHFLRVCDMFYKKWKECEWVGTCQRVWIGINELTKDSLPLSLTSTPLLPSTRLHFILIFRMSVFSYPSLFPYAFLNLSSICAYVSLLISNMCMITSHSMRTLLSLTLPLLMHILTFLFLYTLFIPCVSSILTCMHVSFSLCTLPHCYLSLKRI
jgi:hypothetical protein